MNSTMYFSLIKFSFYFFQDFFPVERKTVSLTYGNKQPIYVDV